MFCNKCGNEIHDDAVICVHCGCAIAGRSIGNKKKAGGVNVINIVQLILALICGVLMFLPDAFGRHLYEVGFYSSSDYVSIWDAAQSWSNLDDYGTVLLVVLALAFVYRIIVLCVRTKNDKSLKIGALISSVIATIVAVVFAVVGDGHVYKTTESLRYGSGYYNSSYLTIPIEYRYSMGIMAAILLVALVAMVILDIVNLVKSKKTR